MIKMKLTLIAAIVLGINICSGQRAITKFISQYEPVAKALALEYGIPVAIILGVSTLESGSGTSVNARQLNNFFGVTGRNSLRKRRSVYKQYASAEDSFRDFCDIMSRKKFYAGLKDNMSYTKWLAAMNHASYAGAKGVWISRVSSIIRKHKLEQYDKR